VKMKKKDDKKELKAMLSKKADESYAEFSKVAEKSKTTHQFLTNGSAAAKKVDDEFIEAGFKCFADAAAAGKFTGEMKDDLYRVSRARPVLKPLYDMFCMIQKDAEKMLAGGSEK
jgi:hypothetical protein